MNDLIKNLKILKSLGGVAVKQSFEDEGASQNDIAIMRIITTKAQLPLNVKVGACEATNDVYFCKKIKVNFAINILPSKKMYKNKSLIGNNPYLYKLDDVEGFDINYPLELKFAEYLFENR